MGAYCWRGAAWTVLSVLLAGVPAGCSTTAGTVGLVVGSAVAVGGHSPNNELQQVYYVGVFDPKDQVPLAVYRIRVHGQASAISRTRFASGWVPAALADSLDTHISFKSEGEGLSIEGRDEKASGIATGRGLVMFGPEGFRPAPRDHRLAIVMGTSPEDFFDAVNSGLLTIAEVQAEQKSSLATNLILEELLRLRDEREKLREAAAMLKETKTALETAETGGASTGGGL